MKQDVGDEIRSLLSSAISDQKEEAFVDSKVMMNSKMLK